MCVPRLDLSRVSRLPKGLTREDITSDSAKTSNRSKWTDDKQSPRTPKTARLPWFQQQEMFTRENITSDSAKKRQTEVNGQMINSHQELQKQYVCHGANNKKGSLEKI